MKDRKGTIKLLLASCLILLLVSVTVSEQIKPKCKYNEFTVQDVIGNLSCVPCKKCIAGQGLSPQCGSYIPYGTRIECKLCVPGTSYSSTYSIESCQPCGICVDHQKVIEKCNRTHNSICGKNCDVGFYLSSVVGDCQKCSWCCPDSSPAEHEAECEKDGVPFFKRCSFGESIRCSPRCTNEQYVIVTEKLNKTCHDCPHCGVGQGLYPRCQSVLTNIKESKCERCTPGKTFSDTIDSSSCKPCKVCEVGKKTERSCNTTHDTLCGDCEHGFYQESGVTDKEVVCKQCSYCCGDGKDVVIPECKAQGLPKNMQCAYTTRAVTKCASHTSIYVIVGAAVGSTLFGVLLVLGISFAVYKYKQSPKYGKLATDNQSEMEGVEVPEFNKEFASEASTPNSLEFRYSGVIVRCHDVQIGEALLKDLCVEICWDQHRYLPKRKEIYLSPLIQFHAPSKLEIQTALTLDIPHSAYHQEEGNTWKIKVLKLALPHKAESPLELTELSDESEIKINPCSVKFTVKELGAYIVVGDPGDPKLAKKRIKCAVFGGVPKTGQTYTIMMYLLDDLGSSFKKLEKDEKAKDRHMLKDLVSLYPDVAENSVINITIKSVMEGWDGELSKEVIKSSEWIDSYKTIPKIEARFNHTNHQNKDFQCNFKLTFEDGVAEIPIIHHSVPECIPNGIQSSDQSPTAQNIFILNDKSEAENTLPVLSAIPKEVLANFCQSIDQAIGEDHTRMESFALKIVPTLTQDERSMISSSDQKFSSLIDLASTKGKEVTIGEVKHALEAEGLKSDWLMPLLV